MLTKTGEPILISFNMNYYLSLYRLRYVYFCLCSVSNSFFRLQGSYTSTVKPLLARKDASNSRESDNKVAPKARKMALHRQRRHRRYKIPCFQTVASHWMITLKKILFSTEKREALWYVTRLSMRMWCLDHVMIRHVLHYCCARWR